MNKRILLVVLLFAVLIFVVILRGKNPISQTAVTKATATLTPTPTPFVFTSYTPPTIEKKPVYKIVMIGDSMTAALGPHGGTLSEFMNTLFKINSQDSQRVLIDNYSKSSNILSINDQLTQTTRINEYTFEPLLSQDFDLILVESFGYNPLSEFGVEDGIKRQNQALDELMTTLISTRPQSAIVFVATIAPNRETYAKKTQSDNSTEASVELADERIAYIKNHIAYAKEHSIPLINIYEKSLTEKGDGDRKYINPNDDIHPSFEGIDFIAHEIANYIYDNKILPL